MKNDIPSIGKLFSLSRDPVVCEKGGIVTSMNPSAVTLFGSDMTGHLISDLIPETILSVEEDPFIASIVIAEKSITVSCTSYGDFRLYSFIIPDPKEEKPVELPFSVSIREITNTIKITSEQIMSQSEHHQDSKLDRYAAILKHNANKLKRLVTNQALLTACSNGTQPFQPTMVSINQVCSKVVEAVSDLASVHQIQLELLQEEEILASVDPELFRIMLLNLLSNSLLHTGPNGKIQVSLHATVSQISITVSDNGTGIPQSQISTIFSRYREPVRFDDGKVSAGLGLSVAESIAKLHNGTIVIQSTPGKGTIIAARLKRRSEPSLMAPWAGYNTTLYDCVMTELSTWLTWKDYLKNFSD